ncbi:hypothetical protein IB286_02295 [Spongiibacter sp. KMU-158]|uniref:Right handed beta helix domain-containing protein n=1 Tax=Spongiibacter pelagi TaxID=2760804 RepID=A0A927GUP9_9GAMM|nr:hypothetical protein [Spongiibacter pelagi]MBD2857821.1 hypothetical protein [Spongiibacter pelagi]
MSEVGAPRGKLVELLWQLKLGYSNQDNGRSIHFNTLLRDSAYRRDIIEEAASSSNAKLRQLGLSLKMLNVEGELTPSRHSSSHAEELNPDIAETLRNTKPKISAQSGSKEKKQSQLPLILGGGLVVVLALAALMLLSRSTNEITIAGALQGEHVWTADKTWLLSGVVYVESGANLTIEPGTVIKGAEGSALVVTRDANLMARGSATKPIVFTSAQPQGQREAGDWGGLVLLGNAPVNQRQAQIEGVPMSDRRGSFGGTDEKSSCGVLMYTRIEFAGYEVYANNELNGLTLGGCGQGTIVRNVQVHRSLDDGIEVFGGNVDLRNVLVTGAGDDALDWDMGWRGRAQYMLLVQYPGLGDNAIEADNLEANHNASPISEPKIYNATLLSSSSNNKYQRAMTLRRGTGGHFHNMIISGFSREAIDVKDAATVERVVDGKLNFSHVLISNIGPSGADYFPQEFGDANDDGGFDEAASFAGGVELGSNLQLAFRADQLATPDFSVSPSSAASRRGDAVPQEEFWDEGADFIGAIRPGAGAAWLQDWTAFPLN